MDKLTIGVTVCTAIFLEMVIVLASLALSHMNKVPLWRGLLAFHVLFILLALSGFVTMLIATPYDKWFTK